MSEKVRFENMLHMAVREVYMDRISAIPSDEEIDKIYTASQAHTKKMEAMIRKESRSEKIIKFSRAASRVAVIVLIAFSLTFSTLLTAEAVRESVVTTVLEWKDKFTRIFMESDMQAEVLPEIRFNYIPESFSLVDEYTVISSTLISYTYSNHDNVYFWITTSSKSNYTNDHIDNEYSNYYILNIDNNSGIWVNTGDENRLIISRNNLYFNISGKLPIEEIVQIYKNIELL